MNITDYYPHAIIQYGQEFNKAVNLNDPVSINLNSNCKIFFIFQNITFARFYVDWYEQPFLVFRNKSNTGFFVDKITENMYVSDIRRAIIPKIAHYISDDESYELLITKINKLAKDIKNENL